MATQAAATVQSLITFQNSQGADCRGTLVKLTRSNLVMEVYNPYSVVQLSEVLNDLCVHRGDHIIYKGRATVSNLMNTGLMLVVSATLEEPLIDLKGLQNNPESLNQETEQFITEWEAAYHLRSDYRLAVGELRSFLAELNRWLEQFNTSSDEIAEDSPLSDASFVALAKPIIEKSNKLFYNFELAAGLIPKDELVLHKTFVQRDLHPLMMRSPFFHRSFYKPLGYAGDYETVNMMLRDRREGPTIYAQIINSYYHQIGPTRAHRKRIDILTEYLADLANKSKQYGRTACVLDMGCGPALEVQRFIRTEPLAEWCQFQLVDFNKETLAHAHEKIKEAMKDTNRKPKVEFIQRSVHELLKEAIKVKSMPELEKYDLIYCAGLFDYLSDKICTRLLRLFYNWIKPGGTVLVTNVHTKNPSRWTMEHIVEWYMHYRNESDMLNLVPYVGDQSIYVDLTGLNVFLDIRKPILK